MRLSVIVATLEGCPFRLLDDPAFIGRVLVEAVEAGGFTLLHRYVHRFEPQGVTGAAVLSESHLALHSWPEEGVLFVDLATCADPAATRRAFYRIRTLVPHGAVRDQAVSYRGEDRASGRLAALTLSPPHPWRARSHAAGGRPAVSPPRQRGRARESGRGRGGPAHAQPRTRC